MITNLGDVPERGVELREAGRYSGAKVLTIILNELKSIVVIRNVRSMLEGKLVDVRILVKKIEVNKTSFYNHNNKHRLILDPRTPKISCRYP